VPKHFIQLDFLELLVVISKVFSCLGKEVEEVRANTVVIMLVQFDDAQISQLRKSRHDPEVVGLKLSLVDAWDAKNFNLIADFVHVFVEYLEWLWLCGLWLTILVWSGNSKLSEVVQHLLETKLVEELFPVE
jgi:hypothetical protein